MLNKVFICSILAELCIVETMSLEVCKKNSISTVPYIRTVWRTMEKFHTATSVLSGVQ